MYLYVRLDQLELHDGERPSVQPTEFIVLVKHAPFEQVDRLFLSQVFFTHCGLYLS